MVTQAADSGVTDYSYLKFKNQEPQSKMVESLLITLYVLSICYTNAFNRGTRTEIYQGALADSLRPLVAVRLHRITFSSLLLQRLPEEKLSFTKR